MTLTIKDIIDDRYQATSISQMLVITRLKDLHEEQKNLRAELVEIQKRLAIIPLVGAELLELLEDMPDEPLSTPDTDPH